MVSVKNVLKYVKSLYSSIIHSIAFYPVLICLGFVILAMTILSFETREMADLLKENLSSLYIQHTETARTILSTVIGGILSLTVFSFSMVMVVLNQASSNYSPRLLPGLISDSKHQIILGIYTGTLLYCLLILTSLGSYNSSEDSVGFSTFLGAIFGILCVCLFIYFIHGISVVIQIDHIIEKIYKESDQHLKRTIEKNEACEAPNAIWKIIYSTHSGYFSEFDTDLMPKALKEEENTLEILPYIDKHIWEGDPLFRIQKQISSEQLADLQLCVRFVKDQHESSTYIGGLIKLMEIAVKAMSPGINDPGTAIDVITRITLLAVQVFEVPMQTKTASNDDAFTVIQNTIIPSELMRKVFQPIRFYARNDCAVTYQLVRSLNFLFRATQNKPAKKVIQEELKAIGDGLENSNFSTYDRENITAMLQDSH
ncbi:MAG: DUF2254 domain-containing protein [Dokdonia sp.]